MNNQIYATNVGKLKGERSFYLFSPWYQQNQIQLPTIYNSVINFH